MERGDRNTPHVAAVADWEREHDDAGNQTSTILSKRYCASIRPRQMEAHGWSWEMLRLNRERDR